MKKRNWLFLTAAIAGLTTFISFLHRPGSETAELEAAATASTLLAYQAELEVYEDLFGRPAADSGGKSWRQILCEQVLGGQGCGLSDEGDQVAVFRVVRADGSVVDQNAVLIGLHDVSGDWRNPGDISFEELRRSRLVLRTPSGATEFGRQPVFVLLRNGSVREFDYTALPAAARLFDGQE